MTPRLWQNAIVLATSIKCLTNCRKSSTPEALDAKAPDLWYAWIAPLKVLAPLLLMSRSALPRTRRSDPLKKWPTKRANHPATYPDARKNVKSHRVFPHLRYAPAVSWPWELFSCWLWYRMVRYSHCLIRSWCSDFLRWIQVPSMATAVLLGFG